MRRRRTRRSRRARRARRRRRRRASSFASTESGSTFECRLDARRWGACTSPQAYTGLADGAHTFEVRAIDAAGNVDATPGLTHLDGRRVGAGHVDLRRPAGTTTATSASRSRSLRPSPARRSSAGSTAAAWGACSSPQDYTGLADGAHTFEVRADRRRRQRRRDPGHPAWTVDTRRRRTRRSTPARPGRRATRRRFTFSSSEAGSTFECRLDGRRLGACTSPKPTPALADGAHTFPVRATDAAGNVDATPASRTWTVDAPAPDTTIDLGPDGPDRATRRAVVRVLGSETGSTFECRVDAAAWTACTSPQPTRTLADGVAHVPGPRDRPGGQPGRHARVAHTLTVDTAAPDTTINGGPDRHHDSYHARFSFTADEPGSTFECRLDARRRGARARRRKAYMGLTDGAVHVPGPRDDTAGNVDASPATRTSRSTPPRPDTTITAARRADELDLGDLRPSAREPGATFECRLDGAAGRPARRRRPTPALADGRAHVRGPRDRRRGQRRRDARDAHVRRSTAPRRTRRSSAGPTGTTDGHARQPSRSRRPSRVRPSSAARRRALSACPRRRPTPASPTGGTRSRSARPTPPATWTRRPASRSWTVAASPSGTVVWQDDFERTSILGDKWRSVGQRTTDHMAQTSTTVARDGGRSARFELRDGDIAGGSDERQQLADMMNPDGTSFRPKEGDEYYMATSHYFVAPFPSLEGGQPGRCSGSWSPLTRMATVR